MSAAERLRMSSLRLSSPCSSSISRLDILPAVISICLKEEKNILKKTVPGTYKIARKMHEVKTPHELERDESLFNDLLRIRIRLDELSLIHDCFGKGGSSARLYRMILEKLKM